MNYLFDTDAITFLYTKQKEERYSIVNKTKKLGDKDKIFISVLSLFELEYSLANATDKIIKKMLHKTIDNIKFSPIFNFLPLSLNTAKTYGEIKSFLKNKHKINRQNIKKYNIDIMLASTALEENCILISGDNIYQTINQFNPKLQTECWW